MNHADEPRPEGELAELFERWLDDRELLDAHELARLEADPRFRDRLQAVRDVERDLLAAAADWRRDVLEREPSPPPELQASLRARIAELATADGEARDAPSSGSSWQTALWSVLAAVAAGLLVWFWPRGAAPEPAPLRPPEFLGPGSRDFEVEVDPVNARLSWSREVLADETVVLTIVDPATSDEVETIRIRGEQSFSPSEEQWRSWPDPCRVEVEIRDVDGERVEGPARVELSRPRRIGRSAREPPNSEELTRLRELATEERAAGELDYALSVDVQRVTALALLERFDLAEQLCAELASLADPNRTPDGFILLQLARIELGLQAGDLHRCLEALTAAEPVLDVVRREYGELERDLMRTLWFGAESRVELVRGRSDLALRAARAGVESAARLGGHPEGERLLEEAKIDLARASLAARQAEATHQIVDGLLVGQDVVDDRVAELLMLRSLATGLYVGVDRARLEHALADLDRVAAATDVSWRVRFGCRVRRAALLWNGGSHQLAAEAVDHAEAELGAAAAHHAGDAPSGDLLMLRALGTLLALPDATPEEAAGLARRLERTLDRLVLRTTAPLGMGAGAPLLAVGRRAAVHEWVNALRAAEPGSAGVRRAFEARLRIESLGTLARTWDVGTPDLDAVRRWLLPPVDLEPDAEIWVYSFGWHDSHLFVVRHGALECHDLRGSGEEILRSAARDLRVDPGDPGDPRVAKALGSRLVPEPVSRRIEAGSDLALTVVGLQDLGGVSAEALRLRDDSLLGDHAVLSHLPSATLGVALSRRESLRRPAAGAAEVVLLGGPSRAEQGFDLSEPAEADFLPVGIGGVHRFLGEDARPEVLRSPACGDAKALILVAHGRRNPTTGAADILLAGPEGADELSVEWLHDLGTDFTSRPQLPPLTIAYVCGAARQRVLRGEDGSQGLAGALLHAGARAVILAQDDVAFGAARAFAPAFGAALVEGRSVARALRAGLVALGDRDGVTAQDRLGGLHIIGLGHLPVWPVPVRGAPWRPWAAMAAALSAAAAVWVGRSFRRRRRDSGVSRGVAVGGPGCESVG